jgi:hypothetical protein
MWSDTMKWKTKMKASRLLLASAFAFAASTTAAVAAADPQDEDTNSFSEVIAGDVVAAASEFVLWDEAEKQRLEKQGFPQYDN